MKLLSDLHPPDAINSLSLLSTQKLLFPPNTHTHLADSERIACYPRLEDGTAITGAMAEFESGVSLAVMQAQLDRISEIHSKVEAMLDQVTTFQGQAGLKNSLHRGDSNSLLE